MRGQTPTTTDSDSLDALVQLGMKVKRRDIVCIVTLLAGIVITIFLFGTMMFPVGLAIMVGALVAMFITSATINRRYRGMYKNTLVRRVAGEFFTDFSYEPEKGYQKEYLDNLDIMDFGNIFESEDMMIGKCGNVAFQRADVYIADESEDSDGHTSTMEYFRGQWLEFRPQKQFLEPLQIVQSGFEHSATLTGLFVGKHEKRHKIETEDMEFNKRFTCYCRNDAEAFYLLTPAMMQAIMRLSQTLSYKMMIAFVNNKLHVLVATHRNSMEPILPKGGTLDRQLADLRNDMRIVSEVVQNLLPDRNNLPADS